MTTLTDTQVVTASGGLVELGYTALTTSPAVGGSWTTIASTTVVADGSKLLVEFQSPYVSAAANARLAIAGTNYRFGDLASAGPFRQSLVVTPAAGSVSISVEFITAGGGATINGSGGTYGAGSAFLRVSKIVSATQWPAVTTGTIICTSTTRPASPFEGQTIYETDTKRSWTRVGTQWVPNDMVFTNEAARDAAITSPTEGMRAYLTAPTVPAATGATTSVPTGITTVYNGSAWVCTTPVSAFTATTGTTTSGSFTSTLTSGGTNPSVTLATGTTALVMLSANASVNPAPTTIYVGAAVSGATTLSLGGNSLAAYVGVTGGYIGTMTFVKVITGLTAGTNTFTMQYQSGSGNTASYNERSITVQGIA
jgi:hypothetical protein